MTEKELVMRAKKDISAFDQIYEMHFQKIFRYVLMRVNNRDVAEEVVSNVFYKAMNKLHMFRWRSIPFSAWLYRIAANEISNYYRKRKRGGVIVDKVRVELEIPSEEEPMSYDFIHHYMKQLPHNDQDIIVLRYFEKFSFTQIAEMTGKKENTLRVNLHRALKKLESLIPGEVLDDVYEKVS
ncbi:MAG: sigma-70 family RNA polymerase sigma factor [Candidatus Cloacimonetes bacterium]|nr:sigma-70 family RNA polymerase sigma factor [Candidatus Cloacimonadota bacterium]